jgi:polysaccharide pyruvyl transferase WcaK-like protein
MKRTPRRIALLHHTGGGNLGDDATMSVVVRNIRRRWPETDITAFSMNPADTEKKHGIPSFPIRRHTWAIGYGLAGKKSSPSGKPGFRNWLKTTRNPIIRLSRAIFGELFFLAASFRILRSFDLLVVSGGGQLTERSGPWGFPYAIFTWVLMARAARIKCIFLNVGAGPLNHPLSKFLVTRALFAADYVSFRDEPSQALAQKVGFTGKSVVCTDSVYDLEVPSPSVASSGPEHPIVGIAPMPYPFCDPREHLSNHQEIYEDFLGKLAIFALALVRQSYSLELFGSDTGADPSAIEDFRTVLQIRHNLSVAQFKPVQSVGELLAEMSAMDFVVTCRFHGVVFAHLLNKPVLAISHHPKVANLMHALGLSQYCVDIQKFDPVQLTDTFTSLARNADEVKSQMAAKLAAYQSELAAQFDGLFPGNVQETWVPQATPRRLPGTHYF